MVCVLRFGNRAPLEEESDSDEDRDYMEKTKSEETRERIEDASLDKLNDMEDDVGADDEAFFEKYRYRAIPSLKSRRKNKKNNYL